MIYDHFVWAKMMKANEKYFYWKLQCTTQQYCKMCASSRAFFALAEFFPINFVINNVNLMFWVCLCVQNCGRKTIHQYFWILFVFFFSSGRLLRCVCAVRRYAHVCGVYIPWKWVVKIHLLFEFTRIRFGCNCNKLHGAHCFLEYERTGRGCTYKFMGLGQSWSTFQCSQNQKRN